MLVVTGDFDADQTKAWIQKYFGEHPAGEAAAASPICASRARRRKSARERTDPLANRPALGIGYHMPERQTPEWFAFGLIDQAARTGRRLAAVRRLVRKQGLTGERRRRDQLGPRQHVRLQRADAVDRAVLPRHATPSDKLLAAFDSGDRDGAQRGPSIRRRSTAHG